MRRLLGSVFLLLCLVAAEGGAEPSLVVRPVPLSFPTPTIEDLNRGFMTRGAFRTTQGLLIRVRSDTMDPWRLTMRARDGYFQPLSLRKSVRHLQWKLNEDDVNEYRDVTHYEQLIYFSRQGGNEDLRMDFVMITQWADPPAAYSLDLLFTVHME